MVGIPTHDGAIASIYSSHLGVHQGGRMIRTKDINGCKSVLNIWLSPLLRAPEGTCVCFFVY